VAPAANSVPSAPSSESACVTTWKAVCTAAGNNYGSEEQWNIEFVQTTETYRCFCVCSIPDYTKRDVYGKSGAKFLTIIFNAKWEHPQAFDLSSCDFALSSTRCMQWPIHASTRSQTIKYKFCLRRKQTHSSETSVSAHQSTRCHNPEDYNLKTIRCFDFLAVNMQAIRYRISLAAYRLLLLCCVSCRVETTWRHFDVSKSP
jgi:hypothetical protein